MEKFNQFKEKLNQLNEKLGPLKEKLKSYIDKFNRLDKRHRAYIISISIIIFIYHLPSSFLIKYFNKGIISTVS